MRLLICYEKPPATNISFEYPVRCETIFMIHARVFIWCDRSIDRWRTMRSLPQQSVSDACHLLAFASDAINIEPPPLAGVNIIHNSTCVHIYIHSTKALALPSFILLPPISATAKHSASVSVCVCVYICLVRTVGVCVRVGVSGTSRWQTTNAAVSERAPRFIYSAH